MPYAESTPAKGWMNTVCMPSSSATRQACCPPAPPKHCRAKRDASCPFSSDTCLMALAMLATAMRRKPSAAARASCPGTRAANFARTASASSGWSAPGPKMAGKCAGWILPTMTLASVTVSGPPLR